MKLAEREGRVPTHLLRRIHEARRRAQGTIVRTAAPERASQLRAKRVVEWTLFGHRERSGDLAAPADPVRNLPPLTDPALAPLVELLRDPSVPKAGHNIKYDWQVLRRAGVELGGVAYDSMIASFLLDPGRRSHAIDILSLEPLGR